MKRHFIFKVGFVVLVAAAAVAAQEVQVNRENRTISVTVTETVRLEADVAVVKVGYRNYGRTKELAFEENVRIANQITKALLDSGIQKDNIETESLRLDRPNAYETPKEDRLQAHQSWRIRVAVQDAEKVVDLAVKAGANEVEDVDWLVADALALEAKANAAALAKARSVADRMAKEFSVKAGNLLYVSNTEPVRPFERMTAYAFMRGAAAGLPMPQVKLFPQKVERQATVHAVFALE